jgi:hypothetical protein
MVSEVETILNEIRERVRADQEQRPAPDTVAVLDGTAADTEVILTAGSGSGTAESLSRLSAHLTTTTRAWDRLPPLYSNRTGMAARIELWIKARFKSLSRWFTWEQVNFNAAVHHALSDTLEALRAHEQELIRIRAEARNEAEIRLARFERSEREINALRANIEAQAADMRSRISSLITQNVAIEAQAADMRGRISNLATQNVAIEARVSETNAAHANLSTQLSEINTDTGAQISNMAKEIDERLAALAADLREEQRVCFKQLSLEASEATVLEDRGRRAIESRLEKLEQPGTSNKK